ncbi:MAG: endonuclease [Myxococcota bacterium]
MSGSTKFNPHASPPDRPRSTDQAHSTEESEVKGPPVEAPTAAEDRAPADDAWTKFSGQSFSNFKSTKSESGQEGVLVAPGVRMTGEPPRRKSRAERRQHRRAARSADTIPTAAPSRPERADLIPGGDQVVPPRRLEGLEGPALVSAIRSDSQMTKQLGYRPAREAMFRVIDNVKGIVEGVYTGRKVRTTGIPSANGENGMNTEHAWPQSKGVRGTPAKYDLHHLFPTNAYANGRRASFPFGVVSQHVRWKENGSKLGRDEAGRIVFEPRSGFKGAVARALFYVSAVYGLELPEHEEQTLRKWHAEEPPDRAEQLRNDEISRFQGNRNPFVDQPELVQRVSRFDS